MLKFQYNGLKKSVWLIGPLMKVGASKSNEIILEGEGVAPLHCYIYINNDNVEIEPVDNNIVYINELVINKKTLLKKSDITRIAHQEFLIVDPQNKVQILPTKKEVVSDEATVFRPSATTGIPAASGWLLQGLHPSLRNKRYPVDGTASLGRSPECELHFSFERLSRKHAEFTLIDGVLMVKDLDSSNGTFHNGERVKQATLRAGDTIAFDKLEFTVIAPGGVSQVKSMKADPMSQTIVGSVKQSDPIKSPRATVVTPSNGDGAEDVKKPMSAMLVLACAAGFIALGVLAFMILM